MGKFSDGIKGLFAPRGYEQDDAETTKRMDAISKEYDYHAEREAIFVERRRSRSFVLSLLFTTLGMLAAAAIIIASAGAGAALGVARAYVETAPALNEAQFEPSAQTSFIYDKDGKLITTYAGIEFREFVPVEEIPDMLKNAFVAVEDIRYYKHDGVDYKRLVSAVLNALRNRDMHGGSTITQQLIKNRVLSQEQTYRRKIQEAYLALELEQIYSKEDILEAYLNDIALGESNYGVKSAAEDYFGKELDELTVKECAMLAGLTQNPYIYNPRKNMYPGNTKRTFDTTEERTLSVLGKMYTAGYITKDQYEAAKTEKLQILETSKQKQLYEMPYFVEYALDDIIAHMLEMRALQNTKQNRDMIGNELRTGGYHIYLTVDPAIQKMAETTVNEWDKYPKMKDPSLNVRKDTLSDGTIIDIEQPQVAAIVLDYHTGALRAVVGGRNRPAGAKRLLNRANSITEVGSAIKPLTCYGPALDNGYSPGSIVYNYPQAIEGYGGDKGYPGGNNSKWYGPVTMRVGLRQSLNIVAARTLFEKTQSPQTAAEYLIKMGVNPEKVYVDGPGLALGTSGITPVQMAAAFGAVGNGGEWLEPLSFSKIVDSKGNVILDANEVRQKRQVYKPSSAWMLVDMMKDVVSAGTGSGAKIKGMSVAGKTGTNDSYKSVYFAGLTPYYAASVWIGGDENKYLLKQGTGGEYAAPLWQTIMAKAVDGLPDKPIIDASTEELGLVKKSTCAVSGLLATEACEKDAGAKKPITDWFLSGTEPIESCTWHVEQDVCTVSGKLAGPYCPESSMKTQSVLIIPPGSELDAYDHELVKSALPHAHFGYDMAQISMLTPGSTEYYSYYCNVHTAYEIPNYGSDSVRIQAQAAINYVNSYLANNPGAISENGRSRLDDALSQLRYELQTNAMEYAVSSSLSALRSVFSEVTGQSIPMTGTGSIPQIQTFP